jgi:hypothetical protein
MSSIIMNNLIFTKIIDFIKYENFSTHNYFTFGSYMLILISNVSLLSQSYTQIDYTIFTDAAKMIILRIFWVKLIKIF